MEDPTPNKKFRVSEEPSIAVLQALIIGLAGMFFEEPSSQALRPSFAEGRLHNSAFRFCVCFLACTEWKPEPSRPDLSLTPYEVYFTLRDVAVNLIRLTPPYSPEDIEELFLRARQILFDESDMVRLSMDMGRLITGKPDNLIENVFWFDMLMRSIQNTTVPITLKE